MLGTKIYKTDLSNYTETAIWCNANNATIEDKGSYYEVVAITVPEPTPAEIQKALTDMVQGYMDTKAQERGYDSILSACSYVDTGIERFDQEGTKARAWRSAVWQKCYDVLAEVQEGVRAVPTEEELIAELPVLEW